VLAKSRPPVGPHSDHTRGGGGGNDDVRTRGFTPPGILFFGRSSEWSCAPPIKGVMSGFRPLSKSPKETPTVRVYRSDPEGITLQIRREHEYMSAWLSFGDALVVECYLRSREEERSTMNRERRSRRILKSAT
jgi:hypothetical protein